MNMMQQWKGKAEKRFGRMGMQVARQPWRWLLGTISFTVLLAAQLINLNTDTSIEGFLSADAPAIIRYNEFRNQFGRDESFIVIIEVEELFDSEFIETFRAFHEELEEVVPYVDTVSSLINARHTYGKNDELIIEDLFGDELPEDPTELARLQHYTYNNPQYQGYLISKDRHLVAVLVKLLPFLSDEENDTHKNLSDDQLGEAGAVIQEVMDRYQNKLSQDLRLSGSPAIGSSLAKAVKTDFMVFTIMALVIIAGVLAVMFRRVSGVLMPLFVMILGLTATISMMAVFKTPIQMTTSMLPSFLLAVCVGYAIHLLSVFYRHYDSGAEKSDALSYALEHSGLAIFFTSITTAAGLGSFASSDLSPVASLGIYGAMGALIAFLYTVFLLPSLIILAPIKRNPLSEKSLKNTEQGILSWIINACANLAIHRPVWVAVSGVAMFVITIAIALQLTFTHDSLLWFPEGHPVRLAVEKTERRMGGTLPVEIVIDTGEAGGAVSPEFLRKLEASLQTISSWEKGNVYIAKTLSVNDVIKETHRALNNNDDDFYIIPDDRVLIRQELFMVELDASEDLFLLVDPSYQTVRATLLIPWLDAVEYMHFIKGLRNYFAEHYEEDVLITGLTVILGQTFAEMLYSTGKSYAIAACAIALMMMLLMGGVRIGLISMLPNLLPITLVLALMKLGGVPLDMFTLLIGSIAIGLTVDDTVHFMHGFQREYSLNQDAPQAIYNTLHTAGRAMLVTTIVLSLGFLIYTQSVLTNLFSFGVLTALCIVFALMADFLFAPALMMLVTRKEKNILNSD